jgi:hypothetical protein
MFLPAASLGSPRTEPSTPPGLIAPKQLGDGLAADGVGDGVEVAQGGDFLVIIESDDTLGTELRGVVALGGFHTGDDVRAVLRATWTAVRPTPPRAPVTRIVQPD